MKPQTTRRPRKGALDLAIDNAIEQAEKLQQGKVLPVGKRLKQGQLGVRLLMPATPAQELEIRNFMEQEWKALEPLWVAAEARILEQISKVLGKEARKL